jgi:hypothetical protein
MECVIKVVAGPEAGQEFRCRAGETVIGRSPRSAVRLSAPTVSYEHAVISQGTDGFFIENLSANGTYLNNERVSGRSKLRARDQLRLGDETVVRVESVPAAAGGGSSRVLLLGLLVAMLLAGLIVVVLDPFSGTAVRNWSGAEARLQEWTASKVAAGELPRNTASLLAEAWRLERAGDRAAASKAWVRLRVYLASSPAGARYQEFAQQDRNALNSLLENKPGAASQPDEGMGAALVQFIAQMERRR